MKTCIMVYGRFNPVHKAHGLMFGTGMMLERQIENSDFKIFMSTSYDKERNPLPFSFKREMIEDYYPMCSKYIQLSQESTLFGVLESLNEEYDSLIMLCGSDRYQNYWKILQKYNGKLYNFQNIQVISCGDYRENCPYSATNMRDAVRKNDYERFCTYVPFRTEEINRKYFLLLKTFMEID